MNEEDASSLAYSLERIATAFEHLARSVEEINAYGVRLGFMEGHSLALRSDVLYDTEFKPFSVPLKIQLELDEDEND